MVDSDESNPLVSVIIVTYDSRNFVGHCLDSVIGSGYQNVEIIVIDNNSKDGTADHVSTEYPKVVLIRNTINMRFAKGINVAITKSHRKLVFLLNPDASARALPHQASRSL